MTLTNKIDFALVFTAAHANPNGDPLNGNRPRVDYDGMGEVSDVCLKRKIRNRLQDMGQPIFVQSDDRRSDAYRSLKERADANAAMKKAGKDKRAVAKAACESWIDVRAFGQVFAFGKNDEENAVSIGIRGPVTIHCAHSLEPVEISSLQITKSVNSTTNTKDPDRKSTDTMGLKHRVDFGAYVTYGSINHQLAELTGFSDEDAELIKRALLTLFENDASSARPDGSMEVIKLIWWRHNCPTGQYSSAKVHRTLKFEQCADRSVRVWTEDLPGLVPEIVDGI